MKKVIVFFLLTTLTGCGNVSYSDVSQKDGYRDFIGKKYQTIRPIRAYLIDDPKHGIEPYVTLKAPPGIEGPEVAWSKELPIGTDLVVKSVEKSNRLFECKTSLTMGAIDGVDDSYKVRLEIRIGNKGETCSTLNPKYFKEIKRNP
jgi:hypothetical protein